ncbi:hypothetical protein PFISCL1PPCAC_15636, partial [Pristionchus fissidentatus]
LQMAEFSATGTVTNVQTKFAFISADRGTVFCPLAASVDSSENCSDMTEKYSIGDIVHFKAAPQSNKNGCTFRAYHVTLSLKSSLYQGFESGDISREDIIAEITLVQETLAYGVSEEMGNIFIPGAAFSTAYGNRLNGFLAPGDAVALSISRQSEKNGCKWRAVSAELFYLPQIVRGTGFVTSLTATVAMVQSHEHGIVRCGILAWEGGTRGNGESLHDVVCFGSSVVFETTECGGGQVASRWSLSSIGLIGETLPPPLAPSIVTSDSFTQTVTPIERMVIKCISESVKHDLYDRVPLIEKLLDEVHLL